MAILGQTKALTAMLVLAVSFALSISGHAADSQATPEGTAPTVVEVSQTPRGVAYKVDSKQADLTPATSLLHLLALVYQKRGAKAPVVVLLDPRVPIDQIWNVDGTLGKAQLTNVRYSIVDRPTQKMVEIRWGSAMPYSKDPPIDPDPLRLSPERH
jgi:hypothetical protein